MGRPRASLEANFALQTLVGRDRFFAGVSAADERTVSTALSIMADGAVHVASLADAGEADAVLVLGDDPTHTAPRLALTLRQAARNRQKAMAEQIGIPVWLDEPVRTAGLDRWSPLFMATPDTTKLDGLAAGLLRAGPEAIARLAFAVAHRLDDAAPGMDDLPEDAKALAARIADALGAAERPLIVAGAHAGGDAVLSAAANIARSLARRRGRPTDVSVVLPECNSAGLALLGGAGGLEAAFEQTEGGPAGTLVVLENDLFRRAAHEDVERFLGRFERVIVIDHTFTATTRAAEVVLAAGTAAESDGTLVSAEGRAQRFYQVYVPPMQIRESWRWLTALIRGRGTRCAWGVLDDVTADCANAVPELAGIRTAAPAAGFRIANQRIAREPARYSGRTAMHADVSIREPKPPVDPDTPLAFSMEGYQGPRTPSPLIPFFWAPGWNSGQSVHKFQDETGRHLRGGDPGVRLFEPDGRPATGYTRDIPRAPSLHGGELRVVRLAHIFGSDELSSLSAPIAERVPAPYVAIGPDAAATRGLEDGAEAHVTLGSLSLTLPVKVKPAFPAGAIGLPAGLGDVPVVTPDVATVSAAEGSPG